MMRAIARLAQEPLKERVSVAALGTIYRSAGWAHLMR
jgi:hypothetical protein